jgi:hypothetical protein
MFHAYALMERYSDLEAKVDSAIEAKPYWCVVRQYEGGETAFADFPRGCEYLDGVGFEFLTMSEARRKSEEIENETYVASHKMS